MTLSQDISDIAIIGAGPAGLLAGYETNPSLNNSQVDIFTKSSKIGHPEHCSGFISYGGLQRLNVSMSELKKKIGYNSIRYAKFFAPNSQSFRIDRGTKAMIVIDRPELDRYLATKTRKRGCALHLNSTIRKIVYTKGYWFLHISDKGKNRVTKSKFLINAEGIHTHLAKSLQLPVPNHKWHFPAFQAVIEGVNDLERDCSELYFSQEFAPGFFGWVIPINEDSARVGVAVGSWTGKNTRKYFYKFLKSHPMLRHRFKKSKIVKTYGGIVPAAGPISRTYHVNYMVIGDAAGQTKATTGGGVNIGGFCGRLAGKYTKKIIDKEISSKQGCLEYQKQWKAFFEPNLSLMKYFRRTISFLPDKEWDKIFQIAATTGLAENMRTTDIDLHGSGLLHYAFQPKVITKGSMLTPHFILSFFRGFLS